MRRIIFPVLLGFTLWSCQSQDTQDATPSAKPDGVSQRVEAVSPTRPQDWPMFMHDLNFSGKSSDQRLKPPLKLRWKFKTGGPIIGSVAVAYGTVYVGSEDQKLYALDAENWGVRWTFQTSGAIRYAPTVWNNRVYVCARDNRVYALESDSGVQIWQYQAENWMDSPPIASGGNIYVGVFPNKILIMDAATGALVNQVRSRVRISGNEYVCIRGKLRPTMPHHNADLWRGFTPGTSSYPVMANGVVYIGGRDKKVHAFDAESQAEIWSYEAKGYFDAAPAIADGMLYITSHDGYVYAFENLDDDALQVAPDKRPIGIVVHDEAPVYAKRDSGITGEPSAEKSSEVLLSLNDGVELPIVDASENWYQVELPDGEYGWMDGYGIGEFEEAEGVQFNKAVCSKVRTLELIEGGESPHWSPNGKVIAFLKRTNLSGQYWKASELWLTDSHARRFKRLCGGNFYNPHLSWSLDSNLIAFEGYEGRDSYVFIINRHNPHIIKLVAGDAPAWSPTANQIAFRRWEDGVHNLYRINSDKSQLAQMARIPIKGRIGAFSYLDPPSWSPDGKRIAIGLDYQHYASGHARIRIQDTNGTKLKEIKTSSQRVKQVNWSADGTNLAYVLSGDAVSGALLNKQLHVVSSDFPNASRVLKHTSPSWSPQGLRLAYLEREDCMGIMWKVWVLDLETNRALPIARTTIDLVKVTWLPDGERLCLWHTSKYLRDGEYKPAKTVGWVVEVAP